MKFFKKLKEYARIGVGHLRIAVFGDTPIGESHWKMERRGYDRNIYFEPGPLDHAIFGGDTGLAGEQRNKVVASMRDYRPRQVFLLGDLGYPVGIIDQPLYDRHIVAPFGDFGVQHLSTDLVDGNHDAYGSCQERAFLNAKLFPGQDRKIRKPNFYWARAYTNKVLVVAFDTTVYDVKLGDPEIQDRQEDFVRKVLIKDERFKGWTKIALCHAGPYSNGSHGDTDDGDYMDFFEDVLKEGVDLLFAGHDHILNEYGRVGRCRIITCGSVSKCKNGPRVFAIPGYATLDNLQVGLVQVT